MMKIITNTFHLLLLNYQALLCLWLELHLALAHQLPLSRAAIVYIILLRD